MASGVPNNMHGNSYSTDTHPLRGPTGPKVEVQHETFGLVGMCPTFTFDSKGRLVTVCVKGRKSELQLRDGRTLQTFDRFELPGKGGVAGALFTGNIGKLFGTTGSGAYFYLDRQDRAVLATAEGDRRVVVIGQRQSGPRVELVCERQYDLKTHIPRSHCGRPRERDWKEDPRCDTITAVMPDWQGRLWVASQRGKVVVITPGRVSESPSKTLARCPVDRRARIEAIQLTLVPGEVNRCRHPAETKKRGAFAAHEEIHNSFAVGPDGVYVVSDCRLYGLHADASGRPQVKWKAEPYERHTKVKVGQRSLGSGTTPTLIGDRYVTIGDNAYPQMNVLVYRRDNGQQVCKVPVFTLKKSACENSFVVHDDSIVVANSYGYDIPMQLKQNHTEGGMTRIDIEPSGRCRVAWSTDFDAMTATPQLSVPTGLLYVYDRPVKGITAVGNRWALTAVDFRTGAKVLRVHVGRGIAYDNGWGPLTIGPDRSAYVGLFRGFVRVKDR
jgi:hypothetical protein